MTLLDEILKKEKDILLRSSVRERLFYAFITATEVDNSISVPDGEIDKVCYSAFTKSSLDVSKELQRSLNAMPVKGLHFSSNLLSLVAFSIKSQDAKAKYLHNYFSTCNLAHQFIIVKIFNEFTLPSTPKVTTDFDKLIVATFINKNYEQSEEYLFKALQNTNDLIELFVLKEAYFEILKVHPNTETSNLLNELAQTFQKVVTASKKRIDSYVNVSILIVAFTLILGLPYFISKKWTSWDLEPYITGIQFSIGVFWFVVMIIFNSNPDWFKVLQNFKSWLLRSYFERKKIDIERAMEIIREATIESNEQSTRKKNFFSKLNWRIILSGISIFLLISFYWYFDIGHKPVEKVDILIGNNYDFAEKLYFRSSPDETHKYKIKNARSEFKGVIQRNSNILVDSTLYEYVWNFNRYNILILVGKTKGIDHQIIDAIRLKK